MPSSTTLAIGGMSCGHCVSSVQKALAAVPAVTVRKVTIGTAEIETSVTDGVNDAAVTAAIEAIRDAGYDAHVAGDGQGEAAVASPRPITLRHADPR